jgi:hypothetical protein
MTGKVCARKGSHTRASGANLPMNHQMIGDVMKNGSEASIHWPDYVRGASNSTRKQPLFASSNQLLKP